MAIHQGIRILDIISEVTISPDLKTTHYAQEEPLFHYIASSNVCIYALEHLSEGETKFHLSDEISQTFNPKFFFKKLYQLWNHTYAIRTLRNQPPSVSKFI